MRRTESLILQSRRDTNNQEFTDTTGISDNDYVQYSNNGQDRLISLIQAVYPNILQKEIEQQVISNQEEYTLPRDLYLGTRIETVEFSNNGQSSQYYLLKKAGSKERFNGNAAQPSYYIRRANKLLLQPKPQSSGSKFRLTYQIEIPRLDVRRGTVLSVVLTTNSITTLTLDPSINIDQDTIQELNYITVIDKDGVVQMRDIPVQSVDTTTGVVTLYSGFTFQDGETISAGNFVCAGKFSSTHSLLPDTCERYLLEYMNWKAFKRDSSTDSQEDYQELKDMEQDILDSFREPDRDVNQIPIISDSFLYADEN